jgi:hypothetical protein
VDGAVCVINIGPLQRRRRRNAGVVALAAGVALELAAAALALPAGLSLVSALLFFAGFSGVFQARAKT